MNELLANPAIQTAVVAVIVVLLNLLVAWLRKTFPTQTASVEANWCYIQPLLEAAMQKAQAAAKNGTDSTMVLLKIANDAAVDFAGTYRKLEGKEPSTAEVTAAKNEFITAVMRATGV